MQIDESFELPFSRAVVWQAFQNIQMLVDCLPGAKLTSPESQKPLELAFQIKMGPIAAAFAGQGDVVYDASSFAGNFSGQGTDRKNNSRVKGEARFSLHESAGSLTRVDVSVEFALTGALAQFGRIGIVKEIASNITAQFAQNLKSKLVVPSDTSPAQVDAGAPELQAPSLNLGRVFWELLKQRLKRLLGRG
jgi:carbon monoxide dehydrogenase subunit G